jgi:hypothetical protein
MKRGDHIFANSVSQTIDELTAKASSELASPREGQVVAIRFMKPHALLLSLAALVINACASFTRCGSGSPGRMLSRLVSPDECRHSVRISHGGVRNAG